MSKIRIRKFWITWLMTIVLAGVSDAIAQTSYTVADLGVLHNWNMSCAMALNNNGWTLSMNGLMDPVSNFIAAKVVTGRAGINAGGVKVDLGTLGGPNSWMNWGGINDRGDAVGMAETSSPDPDGEDVCGFGTGLTCRPFLWQNGHMSALPTLGGNNGLASDINNAGRIAGGAEAPVLDSSCSTSNPHHISLPVLWQKGKAQQLPTVGGDPDGAANGLNDLGQAVGYSGVCAGAIHAISWQNGTASQLDDLGTGAIAQDINDHGQIVGTIGSADGSTQYGALWQGSTMTNLGTLPGDFAAIATGINNQGQVVGSTFDTNFDWSHGFIWQNGVMTDLNTLIPASSNLYITMANKINEHGQISGMGTVLSGPHAGDVHAFLATPVNASLGDSIAQAARTHPKSNLPANFRKQLFERYGLARIER